jgi:ABC-type transport system involved in multi-copper enzyme maturation permease subunit
MTTLHTPQDLPTPRLTGWALFRSQTLALLLDTYRQLNSQKLFWLTMGISMLVVICFAATGINEAGISIFGYTFEGGWNSNVIKPEIFYKYLFAILGVPLWLAWGATILALISTASMTPDMLSGGAVDLYLAKPLSRVRLLMTRFIAGLMFVCLQVGVFTVASFFVIGIRGGSWEPGLFIAIPAVLIFFSYLYSVCTVTGLFTRSTIASLLVTLLAWFAFFCIESAESGILLGRVINEQRQIALNKDIESWNSRLATLEALPESRRALTPYSAFAFQRDKLKDQLKEVERLLPRWRLAHNIAFGVYAVTPKTTATIALVSDVLIKAADLPKLDQETNRPRRRQPVGGITPFSPVVIDELQRISDRRGPLWVLGTSLGFTGLLLAIGCRWFSRKDF